MKLLVYSLKDNDIDECMAYRNNAEDYVESSVFEGLKAELSEIFYSEF